VRVARAAHLPVTCDVTPHHLALHDGWLLGDRSLTWDVPEDGDVDADDEARTSESATAGACRPAARPYDTALRVNPPLRDRSDAAAVLAALIDGTIDAIATDHAPHTSTDKDVPFGDAAAGISGIETAIGLVLSAVDAGVLPLIVAIRALSAGPERVLRGAASQPASATTSFTLGAPADLVVIDRASSWTVTPETILSGGRNTPLIGRTLPGRVLLTIAAGRVAYADPEMD
jgi:dihydroorotase